MPVVSLSFEHHAGDSMVLFGSTPIFKENTLGWSGASHLSSPSTNLTRRLVARQLFRVPPHHETTIHLQTAMPSLGIKPRSYGTAVSITNHYSGWAAC
ncbi:hypothetical protein TNCV_2680661 [Trichonephila clavipes]|uniref:Uncharacterized protein n=1 Tax=Trichonephila clavipes TaxID=2585209 RepID=A0A8X6VBB2_TRICX|nr:hypothetical protein TNCV_2680661 [Trichonephila clavipes]